MSIKVINELSDSFIGTLNKHNVDIGLDERSILMLDQIIDADAAEKTAVQLNAMVEIYGAFLGCALGQVHGFAWEQRKEDGQWVVSARAKNGDVVTINPFNKIYKRFMNGDEDSISYFYQMIQKSLAGELPV